AVLHGQATAVKGEGQLAMGRDDSRALTRDPDVISVYHNRIDKTGHSLETEKDVFLAAGDALNELVAVIKKLFGANASSVPVTAANGFLYQQDVAERDYSVAEPIGAVLFFD